VYNFTLCVYNFTQCVYRCIEIFSHPLEVSGGYSCVYEVMRDRAVHPHGGVERRVAPLGGLARGVCCICSSFAQVGSLSTARQTGRVPQMSPQQPPTRLLIAVVLEDQFGPSRGCGAARPSARGPRPHASGIAAVGAGGQRSSIRSPASALRGAPQTGESRGFFFTPLSFF
jgi:hypothetical protein